MRTPDLVALVAITAGAAVSVIVLAALWVAAVALRRGWVKGGVSLAVVPLERRVPKPAPPDPAGVAADDIGPAIPPAPPRPRLARGDAA